MSSVVTFLLVVLIPAGLLLDDARGEVSFSVCVTGTAACSWEGWGSWSRCMWSGGLVTKSRRRDLCCPMTQMLDDCLGVCKKINETYQEEPCHLNLVSGEHIFHGLYKDFCSKPMQLIRLLVHFFLKKVCAVRMLFAHICFSYIQFS